MSDQIHESIWPKIILWACIAGAVAFLLLMFMAGYTLVGSLLLGILVAILVGILLWIGWYPAQEPTIDVPAPSQAAAAPESTTSAPASAAPEAKADAEAADARAKAAAAMPAAVSAEPAPAEIKPSKQLAGQKELAERKGDWKYEAPAKAPTKKAPAKKKPAAKKSSSTMALAETAKEMGDAGAKKAAAKKPPVAADGKPELLTAPRGGQADDLKQIKGVGPKLEGILHEMGIYHFDQIAGWRKKEVEWVDNALTGVNKGRPTRDDWVKQAKVLAKGGETEFSKRVKKGGVY